MAPILVGLLANRFFPKLCRAVEPACPIIGVIATVILVGASVAKCAQVSKAYWLGGSSQAWVVTQLHGRKGG